MGRSVLIKELIISLSYGQLKVENKNPKEVIAILSGGLDSTVMIWYMADIGIEIKELVSFNYGQRHIKELDYAKIVVREFERVIHPVNHHIVDVSKINTLIAKGALTGTDDVPKEMYNSKNQRVTIVPNRNMIFISIAAGRAVTINASHVAYAAHASDYEVYPDCRPEFIEKLDQALYLGNLWNPVGLYAPFQNKTKHEIVNLGLKTSTPLELTWSCYVGGKRPCLECGTCLERTEAFYINEKNDPALTKDEWNLAVKLLKEHQKS